MQTDTPSGRSRVTGPPSPRATVDAHRPATARRLGTVSLRREVHHVRRQLETGKPPRLRQLAGMSGWAAALVFGGLIVAIRAFVGIVAGEAPGWYQPTIVIIGLIGILLAVAAFVLAQVPKIVWTALTLSTVVLLLGTILTATAM